MSAIKAFWKNGQVVLDKAGDWPDGSRLIVLEEPQADIDFMKEEEQGDNPQAIKRWIDELRALPPLELEPKR